jgi:tetratricopeptide (TPR) repeat protein
LNSSGQAASARRHFQSAWDIAQEAGEDGLAVDAAHMLAICSAGQKEGFEWAKLGLALARQSQDSKAQALIPAILNNTAWDLHDQGRYQEALPLFEEALAEWASTEKKQQYLTARWSMARCLRSLGHYEPALSIQYELEAAYQQAGTSDGFVFEEIAENLWSLGRFDQARPYFEKAYNELIRDKWLVQNQPGRLERLEARAR